MSIVCGVWMRAAKKSLTERRWGLSQQRPQVVEHKPCAYLGEGRSRQRTLVQGPKVDICTVYVERKVV